MLPAATDVLIVGAGPTGLALAITLLQQGVNHVLIDKLEQGQNTSRAAVIHAHTLEVFDKLGVSQQLTERGLRLAKFSIRDRDRVLVRLRFDALPTRFPYLLMLPQDVTEKVLADHLVDRGGTIYRGATATTVAQDDSGVKVKVLCGDAETTIAARYVIGADGMNSMVRTASGIEFAGGSHEESFALADVHMDWPLGDDEVMLFFSPAGLVVVAPLPNGIFRIVSTLDDAPPHPTARDIQAVMDARGPQSGKNTIHDVVWSSRFRLHNRLAQSYRRGRLLVMGDAAHVHSPAGGQGMNTGIVDAYVLGRLLADVVLERRPAAALDIYEQLRHPAALQVTKLAERLTGMATIRGAHKRVFRNAALLLINIIPFAKHRLVMNLSGLSRRKLGDLPR